MKKRNLYEAINELYLAISKISSGTSPALKTLEDVRSYANAITMTFDLSAYEDPYEDKTIQEITVYLLSQSKPIVHAGATDAYTVDGFYCVETEGQVVKYPLTNIYRIVENS